MPYTIEFNLTLECINKDELLRRINEKSNFVLVDTVGKYGGNRFKIKGARTIPYPEVIDKRNELTSYNEIVVYCKNSHCKASKRLPLG